MNKINGNLNPAFNENEEIKVLLVDDEKDLLKQEKMFLEKENKRFNLNTTNSAKKALEVLDNNLYDCVVSDYQMPEMDGLDFLESLRTKNFDIPFIMFTGKGREEVAMKALNFGANRYLHKEGDPISQYGVLAKTIEDEVKLYRSEKRRENARKEWRTTFDALPDIAALISPDHEIWRINKAGLEALGKRREEVIGKKCYELIHGQDSPIDECPCAKVLKSKEEEVGQIFMEHGRYYLASASPILDDEGEVRAFAHTVKDITDQKELETDLKLFKMAVEGSKDLMAAVDKNCDYLFANKAYLKYHNINNDNLTNLSLEDVIDENDFVKEVKPRVNKVLNGSRIQYEMSRDHPELGERVLSINYYPLRELNDVKGIVAVMRDVTEKREIRNKLKKSRKEFKTLFKENPVSQVYLDQNLEILNVNNEFEEKFGYKLEKIRGKHIDDIIVPENKKEEAEKLNKKKGNGLFLETIRKTKYDTIPVIINETPITLEGETRYLLTYRDISDRKRMESRLRLQSRILNQVENAVIATDLEGKIIYWNKKAEDLYGWKEGEVIGDNILNVLTTFKTKNKAEKIMENVTEGGKWSGEFEVKRKDGSKFTAIITAAPFYDDNGDLQGVVGVSTNISKRKEMEEREDFLHALLRHDVRNKIQVAQGYFKLLNEYELPDEVEEYLSNAEIALENSTEIIDKVRTLKKVKEEEIEEIRVGDIIEEISNYVEKMADEQSVEIEINLTHRSVIRGGQLLSQVFMNIIENAIHHSDGDKIKIYEKTTEDNFIFVVEDNGVGIPDEEKDEVFSKGFTTDRERGTGLGLYLVKIILNVYNGNIKVKNSDMGGARFEVTLDKV